MAAEGTTRSVSGPGNARADTVLTGTRRRSPLRGGRLSRGRPGRRLPWGRMAVAAAVAAVVLAVVPPLRHAAALAASKVVLLVLTPVAPSIAGFENLPRGSRILAADGSLLADLDGGRRREQARLDDLPAHVPNAVLAAEDVNFYDHAGVDPSAVLRALLRSSQGDQQGGSTITQQLAKLNYTGSRRTLGRKFREVQYASRLEKRYSKEELLERYMNQVYFGDGAYGISAAAQTFFGVSADRLTPAQSATLAGKIRAPEDLDPRADPAGVQQRRDDVLRQMGEHRLLDRATLEAALATPLQVAPPPPPAATRAPHFVEYVKREAAGIDALGGSADTRTKQLFNGGYTVHTTLEPAAFDAAAQAVRSNLGRPSDPEVAVATVEPGDGAVRVLFGGRDQGRKFDLASQGRRQPGSAFKPFVYLAALRQGIDPRTTLDASSPKQLEYKGRPFTVDNYEGQGTGQSTIDNALTHSINTVFAQVTLLAGPENVRRTAETLGVDDVESNVGSEPAIGLGGLRKGVTPLEQAAAFAALAAKGSYAEPYGIVRIVDRDGEDVYQHQRAARTAVSANEAGVLNAGLISVVRDGTGKAADIGRPAAGKTGTTQNFGDAWFAGFVPQRATAVWVGHPGQVVPMLNVHGRRVSGGSFPAEIWSSYMRRAVQGLPVEDIFIAPPESLSLRSLNPPPPPPPPPPPVPAVPAPSPVPPPVPEAPVAVPPPVVVAPPPTRQTTTTTTSPTTTTSRPRG